ncbi:MULTISPECIES: hypothetical protein [Streptacidiphilus]|uniref:Uncharacterized protein n=1 Tax=Streptacidiphilus cavernicola TaxID=3342716 RepID=A0ABV6UHM6_9ACTN|nr:hypothetical protein [Streptacidiphilus jeojiense]
MIVLIAIALLWGGSMGMTRRCGAYDRATRARCRNPAKGYFKRCPQHTARVAVGSDLVAVVLVVAAVVVAINTVHR